jgi:phage-related protein
MNGDRKPLFWLSGEIKTPPFSDSARVEAGGLLGQVQDGHSIGMPRSRPMPGIGARCHELRVRDENHNWRVVYWIDVDAVLVIAVFAKTTPKTPKPIIDACKARLRDYDQA